VHNFLKVEGSDSLIRDMSTHAIINNNSTEYNNYIKRKNNSVAQQEKIERHENDINSIKQDLRDIRRMLVQLLDTGK